jgi:hypothetical protein
VQLGATVLKVPEPGEIPALVARIARLWAELHEADPNLARAVARSLKDMEIKRE